MKTLRGIILWVLLMLASAAQAEAFFLFNTSGGTGFVTGAYPDFTLTGADNGGRYEIDNYTLYLERVNVGQSLTFDWTYSTLDNGGSGWDPAGYLINDTLYQLSPPNAPQNTTVSGMAAITLLAGDTFGWYVEGVDSRNGPGQLAVSVSGVTLAVPEPATYGLLLAGLALVGLRARRQRHRIMPAPDARNCGHHAWPGTAPCRRAAAAFPPSGRRR